MNYYTIYEKLLISLYFPLPSFFLFICCKNKQYFSFMQVFGLFLLCFREKRLILTMNIRKPVRRLRRSSIPLGVPADLRIFITPNGP